MSNNVYLFLKLNGTDIPGESEVRSIAGEDLADSIECWSFEQSIGLSLPEGTMRYHDGGSTQRNWGPIRIMKHYDKSSPLLWKGLSRNETVEAEFKFFQSIREGRDAQLFKKITISEGRLTDLRIVSPDSRDRNEDPGVLATIRRLLPGGQEEDPGPVWEYVEFRFDRIVWNYVVYGPEEIEDMWYQAA